MPKFGIVAALDREVALFTRNCASVQRTHEGRIFKVFERGETVVICGGIGRHAARRATEALIALYQPVAVQSVGYAGALTPTLEAGALVRPGRVIDAGDGSSVTIADRRPVLITSSSVATSSQKANLARIYGADAVDMEAAAVAKGAEARGIGFTALKVISDTYDFEMPPTERFVTSEGRFQSAKFALFIALRPWLWRTVIILARNTRIATRVLDEALEQDFAKRSREAAVSA